MVEELGQLVQQEPLEQPVGQLSLHPASPDRPAPVRSPDSSFWVDGGRARPEPAVGAVGPGRFERGTLEFERIVTFNDAVYAIALTLLVVTIEVPRMPDSADRRALLDALQDMQPQVVTFFTSFVVIGSFWLANHRFVDRLGAVHRPFMRVNLLYLAFVAFLPFPAAVMGDFADNAVAVTFYAITLAVLSSLEALLFWVAWRGDLLRRAVTPSIVRYGTVAALVPVAVFLISIPIAFFQPWLGIVAWLVSFPLEAIVDRFKPPGADDVFG